MKNSAVPKICIHVNKLHIYSEVATFEKHTVNILCTQSHFTMNADLVWSCSVVKGFLQRGMKLHCGLIPFLRCCLNKFLLDKEINLRPKLDNSL